MTGAAVARDRRLRRGRKHVFGEVADRDPNLLGPRRVGEHLLDVLVGPFGEGLLLPEVGRHQGNAEPASGLAASHL